MKQPCPYDYYAFEKYKTKFFNDESQVIKLGIPENSNVIRNLLIVTDFTLPKIDIEKIKLKINYRHQNKLKSSDVSGFFTFKSSDVSGFFSDDYYNQINNAFELSKDQAEIFNQSFYAGSRDVNIGSEKHKLHYYLIDISKYINCYLDLIIKNNITFENNKMRPINTIEEYHRRKDLYVNNPVSLFDKNWQMPDKILDNPKPDIDLELTIKLAQPNTGKVHVYLF
jgi:hypothetical protein